MEDCIADELARENTIRTIPVCDKHRPTDVKNRSEIQNYLLLRSMCDLSTRIDYQESTTSSCHQPRYSMHLVSEYIYYVSVGRQIEHSLRRPNKRLDISGKNILVACLSRWCIFAPSGKSVTDLADEGR